MLRRLIRIAEKLPNGLLFRLVEDAQFFEDWNLSKKGARSSSRLSQYKARVKRADDAYWKRVKQGREV